VPFTHEDVVLELARFEREARQRAEQDMAARRRREQLGLAFHNLTREELEAARASSFAFLGIKS
jgi:hypothetical protein